MIEVRTQAQLDAALRDHPGELIVCVGDGYFEVSDSVSVSAWGSVSVSASDSVSVRATKFVAVHRHSPDVTVIGGVLIDVTPPSTVTDWLDWHGITRVSNGVVLLYKAVGDDWISSSDCSWAPGSMPVPDEWDPDPDRACGAGLHVCPSVHHALGYRPGATRFLACPVRVDDLRVVLGEHQTADKARVPRLAAPCWECDINGDPIGDRAAP